MTGAQKNSTGGVWGNYMRGLLDNANQIVTEPMIVNKEYREQFKKTPDKTAEIYFSTVGGITKYVVYVKDTENGQAVLKKTEFANYNDSHALREWATTPEAVKSLIDEAGFRLVTTSFLKDIESGCEKTKELAQELRGRM